MRRTILAILFLAALAGILWFGARWLAGRDDLEATVLFDSADRLAVGSPVVTDSLVIGKVTGIAPLEGRDAVSVRIEGRHRDEVLVDSRFSIDGGLVRVSSTFSFGRPVEDGDVLYARESKIARWFGEKGEAAIGKIREEAARLIDREDVRSRLEEWSRQWPEWEKAGDGVVQRNLDEIASAVDRVERDLREKGRELDAERLRREFESWLERMKAKWQRDEPAPSESSSGTVR